MLLFVCLIFATMANSGFICLFCILLSQFLLLLLPHCFGLFDCRMCKTFAVTCLPFHCCFAVTNSNNSIDPFFCSLLVSHFFVCTPPILFDCCIISTSDVVDYCCCCVVFSSWSHYCCCLLPITCCCCHAILAKHGVK